MDDRAKIARVLRAAAALLQAGDVRQLRQGGPSVSIGGRNFVLSSDGGPLGDREDDDAEKDPRIIRPQGGEKHRYLWLLDTDTETLAMWRVSDGNEKHFGSAAHDVQTIKKLDRRGQLNRCTTEEFEAVERHMRKVEKEHEEALERYVEENKDDLQRTIDKAAVSFFDTQVRDKVERAVAAVEDGAIPLGFKPDADRTPAEEYRSKVNWALEAVLRREFTLDKFEAYCRQKGIDLDQADIQATDWALKDVYFKVASEFLPPR